jgi:uncharacterized PurR-regulated membrane protein YhhQ (DUF165 family)
MSTETPTASPGHVPDVPQSSYEKGYMILTVLFVALLMLTNVIGTKLFELPMDLPVLGGVLAWIDALIEKLFPGEGGKGALVLTAGIVTYPLTFLCTDIVSEVYGRRRADRMVILGFVCSLLMLGILSLGVVLPPAEIWTVPDAFAGLFHPDHVTRDAATGALSASSAASQAAYSFTFDAPGILLLASMTAYLCAQLVDNRLFHFWRRLSGGRHLWFRNNMSTLLSQLVDTVIVNFIFLYFYWDMALPAIGAVVIGVYFLKFLLALADTPLCYLGVWLTRRSVSPSAEGASSSPAAPPL